MRNSNDYRELFAELYNSGEEIINNTTKETFVPEDGEEFRQCWDDTATRRELPKYWFVSDKENLLSVKKDKLVWLNKNRRKDSNKISYKFARPTENGAKNQNIEAHDLVGLVWGSEAFGHAEQLLEEKGLEAFGINSSEEDCVQGHHISGDDTDNSPENIKFVTDKVHSLMGNSPKPEESDKKHFAYMEKAGKILARENPDKITILLDGYVYDKTTGEWSDTGVCDVISVDSVQLSPGATIQLKLAGISFE